MALHVSVLVERAVVARATTAKSAAFGRTSAESMRGMLLMLNVGCSCWPLAVLKPREVGVREGSLNFAVWQAG
jgi:hypothetical protein